MYAIPKENRTQPVCRLVEEFKRKGYHCREIREQDSTLMILTHETRPRIREFTFQTPPLHEKYKACLRDQLIQVAQDKIARL